MERYTYEIRPNKPFNFMDKTIRSNCSLQLSVSEALTIVESNKARVYRIFPDINNSVKVDKNNIHELHRKYFNSKPIINRAKSITEKALDKSEDKVISSSDAFVETREEKTETKIEEKTDDISDSESGDKEISSNDTLDETIEEKIDDISDVESEDTLDETTEESDEKEIAEETKEEVLVVNAEESDAPIYVEKEENKNRFYNTQIMTSGKKKHKR